MGAETISDASCFFFLAMISFFRSRFLVTGQPTDKVGTPVKIGQ